MLHREGAELATGRLYGGRRRVVDQCHVALLLEIGGKRASVYVVCSGSSFEPV
jgi:hypothetical protein